MKEAVNNVPYDTSESHLDYVYAYVWDLRIAVPSSDGIIYILLYEADSSYTIYLLW